VTLGQNITAEKVSFASLDELSTSTDLLAYKLAGLTFKQDGEDTIATVFGEVFISTVPSGADIYINGVKKGKSPDLFSRIPAGLTNFEARMDNLYASADLSIGSGTSELAMELEELKSFGNLFVKSSRSDVDVYLADKKLGPLRDGFFRDLPVGDFSIVVKNNSLYWEGSISIVAGESVKLDVYPKPYTDEQLKKDASVMYSSQLEDFEIQAAALSEVELTIFIKDVELFLQSIKNDKYTFSELEKRADTLILELNNRIDKYVRLTDIENLTRSLKAFEKRYEFAEEKAAKRNVFTIIFSGLAISSLGTSGVTWYLGNEAYTNYDNTLITSEAVSYREKSQMYDIVKYSAGAAGLVFSILPIINWIVGDERRELRQSIKTIKEELKELGAEL
jgi:hypothetical protein